MFVHIFSSVLGLLILRYSGSYFLYTSIGESDLTISSIDSSSLNESNVIRASTGVSADWYTPIGPLSFSFSQELQKAKTDKTESIQFNLGTTF